MKTIAFTLAIAALSMFSITSCGPHRGHAHADDSAISHHPVKKIPGAGASRRSSRATVHSSDEVLPHMTRLDHTIEQSTVQGATGRPHVGLVPTMKKIVP